MPAGCPLISTAPATPARPPYRGAGVSLSDRVLAWLLRGPQAGALVRRAAEQGAAERWQALAEQVLAERVARIKAEEG